MKKLLSLAILGGIGWFVYTLSKGARRRGFERVREHLGGKFDLNHCSREELLGIEGVTDEMADRIIDHRPYRTKFDLTSQMALSPAEYEIISQHIKVVAPRAAVLTPDGEAIA